MYIYNLAYIYIYSFTYIHVVYKKPMDKSDQHVIYEKKNTQSENLSLSLYFFSIICHNVHLRLHGVIFLGI